MKECNKCKISKDLEEFIVGRKTCNDCRRKYHQEYYHKSYRKDKVKAHSKKLQDKLINIVQQIKSTYGCQTCSESDPCCLDFHHINDDKDYNVSDVLHKKSWPKLITEINKCVIVCRNCHSKIHAGKIQVNESQICKASTNIKDHII